MFENDLPELEDTALQTSLAAKHVYSRKTLLSEVPTLAVGQPFSSLRSLVVLPNRLDSGPPPAGLDWLNEANYTMPNLILLHLPSPIDAPLPEQMNHKALTFLFVDNCFESLALNGSGLPSLKTLSLSGSCKRCSLVGFPALDSFTIGRVRRLLKVENCPVLRVVSLNTGRSAEITMDVPSLHILSLDGPDKITMMSVLPNLQVFAMNADEGRPEGVCKILKRLRKLGSIQSLCSIFIEGTRFFSPPIDTPKAGKYISKVAEVLCGSKDPRQAFQALPSLQSIAYAGTIWQRDSQVAVTDHQNLGFPFLFTPFQIEDIRRISSSLSLWDD